MATKKRRSQASWDDIVRQRLHDWFKDSKLTQADVGRAVGYTQTAVSAYFLGKGKKLSIERMMLMAKLFRRDARLLLDEHDAIEKRPASQDDQWIEQLVNNCQRAPKRSRHLLIELSGQLAALPDAAVAESRTQRARPAA